MNRELIPRLSLFIFISLSSSFLSFLFFSLVLLSLDNFLFEHSLFSLHFTFSFPPFIRSLPSLPLSLPLSFFLSLYLFISLPPLSSCLSLSFSLSLSLYPAKYQATNINPCSKVQDENQNFSFVWFTCYQRTDNMHAIYLSFG